MKVDTTPFRNAYGKGPRGKAQWAFTVDGEIIFSPTLTFTKAKKWLARTLREQGVRRDVVVRLEP